MTAADDRAREEIAAALIRWWADESGEPVDQLDAAQESARQYADALLPTVRALMDQAAARALMDEAYTLAALPRVPLDVAEYLRDRARALTATEENRDA